MVLGETVPLEAILEKHIRRWQRFLPIMTIKIHAVHKSWDRISVCCFALLHLLISRLDSVSHAHLIIICTQLLNTVVKSDHSKWLDTQNNISDFFSMLPISVGFTSLDAQYCHLIWMWIEHSTCYQFRLKSWQNLSESSSPGISIQPGLLQACDSALRCSPTITQMKSKCKRREVVGGGQGCPACLSLGDKIVCW